jgi:hypothetical protein
VPNIKNCIKVFKENSESILIMVSHSDIIDASDKYKFIKQFFDSLKNCGITQKAIAFSNNDCDFK